MSGAEGHMGFARETLGALDGRKPGGFVSDLRARAFDEFEALPVPSPETEEWRYTDLRAMDLSKFIAFSPEAATPSLERASRAVRAALRRVGKRSGLCVQHNSTVVAAELDPAEAAKGVVLTSIDEAARSHEDLLAETLHQAVPSMRSRFTALHAAFRSGGTLVYVPPGVAVTLPLQNLNVVDRDGVAVFPHTVLVAGEGADVTYIDRFVSPDLRGVLSDAVTEIYAGPNSRVRYVSLQEWGSGVTHLSVQRAMVGRDAEVRSLGVAFGASLSRSEVESILGEDGGSSEMLGLYFADGDQHFDHRSIQDHIGSRTSSDLLYKGVLRDRSRTIYSGTVIIRPGAHKCDAYQTNRNILLSEDAKADSIPNLEILSNDPVRCGHAASVGPVDEDTLFYIESRGIPPVEAQKLVVFGFFQEVLDRVRLPEVRHALERTIGRELERGAAPGSRTS